MIRTYMQPGSNPIEEYKETKDGNLLLIRDAHDSAAFSRRKRKRFNGKYIWFPSAEDLLVQKLKVGRPQDFIDANGIVERMQTKLDRRYLNKWARKLGLMAQLSHVLSRK